MNSFIQRFATVTVAASIIGAMIGDDAQAQSSTNAGRYWSGSHVGGVLLAFQDPVNRSLTSHTVQTSDKVYVYKKRKKHIGKHDLKWRSAKNNRFNGSRFKRQKFGYRLHRKSIGIHSQRRYSRPRALRRSW